jgi:hypothetical protein
VRVFLQLAQTKHQHEQALKLLRKTYEKNEKLSEKTDLWITKFHALPSTNTAIALRGDTVIGAITLFGGSPFRLPCENKFQMDLHQQNLEGRVAEISAPGFLEKPNDDLLFALHHFISCFGASFCHYDAFVSAPGSEWQTFNQRDLGFDTVSLTSKEKILFRNARESEDYRKKVKELQVEYFFPEKKFFLVAHQSMSADTLDYLFNQKSKLFESLTDIEVRVLKNIFDHKDFAHVFPERKLSLAFRKEPKSRRFPMNCEGYLCRENGKKVQLQVLDVSREGIKIQTEDPISRTGTFPLTISVGVMKQAEVIAEIVWCDEVAQIAGLVVKSGCNNWKQLVEYLEKESTKIVAA